MKTKLRHCSGLTLMEAMIVVVVLTIGLVGFLLPRMARAKGNTTQIRCRNELKWIGLSFRQWALDNDGKFPMHVSVTNGGAMEWAQQGIAWPVFQVMSNDIMTPKGLICPGDFARHRITSTTFGSPNADLSSFQLPFTNNQSLSYFVNPDANQTQTNLLLTGDSHFEIGGKEQTEGLRQVTGSQKIGWSPSRHKKLGNLCFTDGSVREFDSKELPAVFNATGLATNRLVLP